MKRAATAVILLASLVLGTTASAPESTRQRRCPGVQRRRTTKLTVWVGWSARELSEFKKVAAEYDRKNAAVEVKVVGGINDDKIIAALRGGNCARRRQLVHVRERRHLLLRPAAGSTWLRT